MKDIIILISVFLLLFPNTLLAAEKIGEKEGSSSFSEGGFPEEFCDPFAQETPDLVNVADPFEPFNRASFWINDKFYRYVLNPVVNLSQGVPEAALEKVAYLYRQIFSPKKIANVVFEFEFRDAGNEMRRLLFAGIASLGKLSDSGSDEKKPFAQTDRFAQNEEIYLILPVLGPLTLEDLTDSYLDMPERVITTPSAKSAREIQSRLKIYQCIRQDALDPYLFMRNAFEQQREAEARKAART